MELQEIEVVIDSSGELRLQVRGVKGKACLTLTESLEAALGGEVGSRQMTSEFYEAAQQESPLRQSQQGR